MGTGTYDDVFDASAELLEAELRVPFADRVRAMSDHVDRTKEWEKRAEGHWQFGVFGNREGMNPGQQVYDRFRDLREQAEEQLRQVQGK